MYCSGCGTKVNSTETDCPGCRAVFERPGKEIWGGLGLKTAKQLSAPPRFGRTAEADAPPSWQTALFLLACVGILVLLVWLVGAFFRWLGVDTGYVISER